MRLDVYLKLSRLLSNRNLAMEFAKAGKIEVNGKTAKPSYEVKTGDLIKIKLRKGLLTVIVIQVPEVRQVAKKNAGGLYELQAFEKYDLPGG